MSGAVGSAMNKEWVLQPGSSESPLRLFMPRSSRSVVSLDRRSVVGQTPSSHWVVSRYARMMAKRTAPKKTPTRTKAKSSPRSSTPARAKRGANGSDGEELAVLFARKFPGRPKAKRAKAPAWMPVDLAHVYQRIGPGTVIAPHHGRALTPDECKDRRELMDRVDNRGEWLATTWMPFSEDASGGRLCFDTKSKRVIYVDAPTTGEVPKIVGANVAAWMKATTRALAKVPDPPDPDEDDYIEDEQEQRFSEVLREVLLARAKPVGKLKPRTDIPPAAPPPDAQIPKHDQLFCTFKQTKKHALDGLYIARGVGTADGKCKLISIGSAAYGGKWPRGMWRLLFYWDHDEHNQGRACVVLLDAKKLEAFVTLDDFDDANTFVKAVDGILKKLGFRFDVLDDPKHRHRVVTRFQKYLDGN